MDKTNNDKLIDYIDGAKDWLDKAKTEYSQANPIGGELKLNLAQAEIKYAWELSRSNYVSNTIQRIPERKIQLWLPAAAALVIFCGVGVWLGTGGFHIKTSTIAHHSHPATPPTVALKNGTSNVTLDTQSSTHTAGDIVLDKTGPLVESEPSKVDSKPVVDLKIPERNSNQIGNTVVASQNRIKENPSVQPNLQPVVSKLAIDEDALTKEASHSLRNGK